MRTHALHEQLRRTDEVLLRLTDLISQQKRVVGVLGAKGHPTEHAAGLLASFREAEAAEAAYKQELEARNREEPTSSGDEVSDLKSEIPVTYV